MPARGHPYRSPPRSEEPSRGAPPRGDLAVPLMTIAGGVLGLAIAAGGGADRPFEAGAGTMMALFGTGALVIELRGARRR